MRQGLYTWIFSFIWGFFADSKFPAIRNKPNEALNKVTVKLLSERELIELEKKITSLDVENLQPRTITNLNSIPKKISIPPKTEVGNEIGITEPNTIEIKSVRQAMKLLRTTLKEALMMLRNLFSKELVSLFKKMTCQKNRIISKQKIILVAYFVRRQKNEIISGALKIAKLPPSKPTFIEQSDQAVKNKPSLRKKNDEVYNNLVEQVVNNQKKDRVSKRQFRD